MRRPALRPQAPAALGAGLLCVIAYAAFAHGATDIPDESYVQVALALLALLGCAAWLGGGRPGISTSGWGWAALALLGAFAVWSGVSLLWTVAPSLAAACPTFSNTR